MDADLNKFLFDFFGSYELVGHTDFEVQGFQNHFLWFLAYVEGYILGRNRLQNLQRICIKSDGTNYMAVCSPEIYQNQTCRNGNISWGDKTGK